MAGRSPLDLESRPVAPRRAEIVAAIDATQYSSPPCHRSAIGIVATFGDLGDQRVILLGACVLHLSSQYHADAPGGWGCDPNDGLTAGFDHLCCDPVEVLSRAGVVGQADEPVTDLDDTEILELAPHGDPRRRRFPRDAVAEQDPLLNRLRRTSLRNHGFNYTIIGVVQPLLQNKSIADRPPGAVISRKEWVGAWGAVAANSFGGPAGQISVMHEEIVIRRRWVGERRFLHALNYCMLLPGPEAQQLATYIGWLLRGPTGGLFAGALFIVPGFVSIMALSVLFAAYGDLTWVTGLFFGISAAVVAVVASAVVRIGRRVIKNRTMLAVAISSFVAIFVFELPFPLIVAVAGSIGYFGGRRFPEVFNLLRGHDETMTVDDLDVLVRDQGVSVGRPSLGRAIRVLAVGLGLWFGPILVLVVVGRASVFVDVAWFFSTAAVLTFGGAYSVLAYISQESVTTFGWLEPEEMVSGLGMAETTPGPLIQVVQFVGFMGPYRDPGSLSPLQAGALGAMIATWVTFVPSFLWIFLGAPFIEHLRDRPALTSALSTVTAAVVGVVLNLAIWFALFTLFDTVDEQRRFGALFYQPDVATLDGAALGIAVLAGLAIFRFRVPAVKVVAAAAAAGVAYQFVLS